MGKRKIKYRETTSHEYYVYIDIGACEKHSDFLPLYNESKISYKNWHLDLQLNSIGVQILTLHYYLLDYNSDGFIPKELKMRIKKNIDFFNKFNRKWFDPDFPCFNYLDLNWEDIEDQVASSNKNDNGTMTHVEFKDGSHIQFLSDDDTIKSLYLPEDIYPDLKQGLELIIEKLK